MGVSYEIGEISPILGSEGSGGGFGVDFSPDFREKEHQTQNRVKNWTKPRGVPRVSTKSGDFAPVFLPCWGLSDRKPVPPGPGGGPEGVLGRSEG